MGKIKTFSYFNNEQDFDEFKRFVSNYITNITQIVNGGLDFKDNIRSSVLTSIAFDGITVQTIPHTLGFIPNGYLVVYLDAAAVIYKPVGVQYAWTSSVIYLQSNVAVNAKIYII